MILLTPQLRLALRAQRVSSSGGTSGGLLGAFTSGGLSRSVTRTVETTFLELRYQLERNGAVYTTVIPFGADRRGADALCATLTRFEQRD